jgi:hypothetical protein
LGLDLVLLPVQDKGTGTVDAVDKLKKILVDMGREDPVAAIIKAGNPQYLNIVEAFCHRPMIILFPGAVNLF